MEAGVPNSFIPKDASVSIASVRSYEGGGLGELFSLIAIVLLVASGALAGGAFLYSQYLTSQSASKLSQIQAAQATFDPALIQQLTRLNDRMKTAQQLLSSHLAPSAFFAALNQATLSTIQFTGLDLQASDSRHITIKMQGIAQSVNSVALQADLFGKNGIITNPIFSNIDRQADGVHFDLVATLNPAALNYSQLVSGGQITGVNTLPATTANPNTSTSSAGAGFAPSAPATSTTPSFNQPKNSGATPASSQVK